MTTKAKPINKCEKCGCEILDGDRLCVDCYKKKFALLFGIFFFLWLSVAIITAIIFETMITFGIWWFWFLLFPYVAKKSRYITKRKMYYSVPVTLDELAPKLLKDPEIEKKYRKKYGYGDDFEFSSKYFALYVQDYIYKDLTHCKSNKLSEHPHYISFIRDGSLTTSDLLDFNNSETINSATFDLEKTHKNTNNTFNQKNYIISIVVLCFAVAGIFAFSVYQYAEFKNLTSDYTKLQEEYDSLSAKYDDAIDEYSETQRNMVEARMELEKYRKYAVFVNEDSTYYHTYKCPLQKGTFWIYNINAAESRGYSPCPICRD